MSLETYLRAAPKAELHVHLEGAILPATLLALAAKNGMDLPATTEDEVRRWFVYRDFRHFIEIYVTITRCLRDVEDYERITYDFGAEMARQNIKYAEVTFSPSTHKWLGVSEDVYFAGLTRGRERARADFGVEIAWVFDLVRASTESGAKADYTVGVAIDGMRDGVVALGLGGMEEGFPPEPFASWFARAQSVGLHSTPHAGEIAGPTSVWGAIRTLGAERIGHGVRSIEDPELVAYLAEHGITLEVCPTSNIRLGVYSSLAEHPLRRLREAGVSVTINSDDPPLFNTTLTDEVLLLHTAFGYDIDAIDAILLNGIRASFLPPDRKALLEQTFVTEMQKLKTGGESLTP
jgi:aminodeoxyfutalosine deaminase